MMNLVCDDDRVECCALGSVCAGSVSCLSVVVVGQRLQPVITAVLPLSTGSVLLSADYSQLELRVLAALSGDAALLRILNADDNNDVFLRLAAMWRHKRPDAVTPDERQQLKQVFLLFAFICLHVHFSASSIHFCCRSATASSTAWVCARWHSSCACPTTRLAGSSAPSSACSPVRWSCPDRFMPVQSLVVPFADVQRWLLSCQSTAGVDGASVRSLAGRLRLIGVSAPANQRAEAERKAVNTTVQASAADIFRCALAAVHEHVRQTYGLCHLAFMFCAILLSQGG